MMVYSRILVFIKVCEVLVVMVGMLMMYIDLLLFRVNFLILWVKVLGMEEVIEIMRVKEIIVVVWSFFVFIEMWCLFFD